MSETTEVAVETRDEAHDDHHPSDWEYVKVAIILAVVTAAEVATYFESVFTFFETRWILLTSLFTMMIFKGWLVARVFMHLKQDKPVLQQSFFAGVLLATAVYIVTLLAFNVFG
ncbi:MAG: cytochrome C oxidase subunit IV family protein [Acidimicrobiales bacterium]|nr:cytochrome C oxidase subunit IV family protein [Acidimicrobiales bacterium]